MIGSIALVGSGEYLPAMAKFERSLIDDAIANGKSNTYFQLPTAAGRESEDRLDYWRTLGGQRNRSTKMNGVAVRGNCLPQVWQGGSSNGYGIKVPKA